MLLLFIGEAFIDVAVMQDVDININLVSILEIIFLFALALIFEYGSRIQEDSKGKIYGKVKNKAE